MLVLLPRQLLALLPLLLHLFMASLFLLHLLGQLSLCTLLTPCC